MCIDYGDYDDVDGVLNDCVMAPLSGAAHSTPAYVTAFYESHDVTVACSNGSMTSSTRVHVISVAGDDVRRRLPRIRVNIVSDDGAGNVTSGMLYVPTLPNSLTLWLMYRLSDL